MARKELTLLNCLQYDAKAQLVQPHRTEALVFVQTPNFSFYRNSNGRITQWDHSRNKGQNCSINETHGHHAGYFHCVRLLSKSAGVSDLVARFAGDEFVVLACDRTQTSSLITILEDTLSANLLRLEERNELSITVISEPAIIRKMSLSSMRERMNACFG